MSTEKKLKIAFGKEIHREMIKTFKESMAEYFKEAGYIETYEEILKESDENIIIHALTTATNHYLKDLWELKKEADQT